MVNSKIIEEMRKKPAACYVLSGDDSFQKEEFLEEVKSILPPSLADFNYDVFQAGVDPVKNIISTAMSYPFSSDVRVVAVKDCRQFREEEQEAVLSYIARPSGHTLLLLDFDRAPGSKSFYKKLVSAGREFKFKVKNRNETALWLREKAARSGKKLSAEALEMLQAAGGENLRLLANEIEKLSMQAGDSDEITGGDAGFSAARAPGRTGFELGSAISGGKCAPALKILYDLSRGPDGASEMIIGALAWHFRAVWKASAALRAGVPPGRIASVCKIPPFRVYEFTRFGKQCSDDMLEEIFRQLLLTDIRLKTRQTSSLDLELLVVKLCGFHSA